jgi:alkylation response protein AidB-like acyl-CoA dehydrogenase
MIEFHDELREIARAALAKNPSWASYAEMGWLGLEVPEACGGAGATFEETAVILHELGRAAAPGAYLGSVVLGVGALNLVEPSASRDELLSAVASGSTHVAIALPTGDAVGVPFSIEDGKLHGAMDFVPDAPAADRVLVLALDGDTPVLATSSGLAVTEQPVVDATRQVGTAHADGAAVSEVSRFADPASAVQQLLDRAALAVACDSLGLAEAMLDATVAYAGVREQFGRPIGSFQAVKHACADMLVAVTVGRELVGTAVRELDTRAVSMAKANVCGSAVDVVGKAMQLHGGIGYTWESGIHTYLKRAVFNRSLFGSPSTHRRRLGELYR